MQYQYLLPLALVAAVSQAACPCPDGKKAIHINGEHLCCPGVVTIDDGWEGCVIGCKKDTSPCFPHCHHDEPLWTTSGECTSVAMTATDYTQLLYGGATTTATTTTTTASTSTATDSGHPTVSGKPCSCPSSTMSHTCVTPTAETNCTAKPTISETGDGGDDGTTATTTTTAGTTTTTTTTMAEEGEEESIDEPTTSPTTPSPIPTDEPAAAGPLITQAPMLALAGGLAGLLVLL